MKKTGFLFSISFLVFSLCALSISEAQLIVDPSNKVASSHYELGFTYSSFDADGVPEDDVLGVYLGYGFNELFDVYGFSGYFVDGEGPFIGGGGRILLSQVNNFDFLAFGQLFYQDRKYTYHYPSNQQPGRGYSYRSDVDGFELSAGAVGRYNLTDQFRLYSALQVVPFTDTNRDDIFIIRAGAAYDISNISIRGEFSFLGEESYSIGVGYKF